MEVNKISATIRYSQDTGKGSWKVVELGAEPVSATGSFGSRRSPSFITN